MTRTTAWLPWGLWLIGLTASASSLPQQNTAETLWAKSLGGVAEGTTLPSPSVDSAFYQCTAAGPTRQYSFTIRDAQVAPACSSKTMITIDGGTQGPDLVLDRCDTLQLTVDNRASLPTTIHFHGLSQRASPLANVQANYTGTPQFDGAAWVSQVPFQGVFTYTFQITDQVGTFWYHAHTGIETRGVLGAIIVNDPAELRTITSLTDSPDEPYHEDRVIFLSDFWNADDAAQQAALTYPVTSSSGPTWAWVGNPDAILINGRTIGCSAAEFGPNGMCRNVKVGQPQPVTFPSPGTPGSTGCAYSQFTFEPDRTYRLRIIAATTLSYMAFSIDGHSMTLIEADGHLLTPKDVGHVEINSGQRISVLLRTKSAGSLANPTQQFAMYAEPRWRSSPPTNGVAILQYTPPTGFTPSLGASPWPVSQAPWLWSQPLPATLPAALPANNVAYGDWFQPAFDPTPSTTAPITKRFVLGSWQTLEQVTNKRYWKVLVSRANDSTSNPVADPVAARMDAQNLASNDYYRSLMGAAPGSSITALDILNAHPTEAFNDPANPQFLHVNVGEWVEVVIENYATAKSCEQHSWHLHGHSFLDMGGSAGSWFTAGTNPAPGHRPHWRDTVTVYGDDSFAATAAPPAPSPANNDTTWDRPAQACAHRVLRFKADNRGVWPLHCHIVYHSMIGMGVLLAVH